MPDKEPRVSKTRKRETKDKDAEKQPKEKQRKRTNIPLEVNLVRLRPRENPRAPELRLVDDEEVQDRGQIANLIRAEKI